MEIKNNGIIFEVIKTKIDLWILELNKYLIPKKLFTTESIIKYT